jgi:TonB family protein
MIIGIALALAAAASARAEETLKPNWSRTPSWAQMQAAFPAAATADSGSVMLRCSVGAAGTLSGCSNRGEKPDGQGFYEAALALAPLFVAVPPPDLAPGAGYAVELPFNFTRPGAKDPRTLTNPDWVHAMSLDEQRALFPAAAPPSTEQGAALLRCQITAAGTLQPCKVLGEEPKKQGFGDAALKTAERMAMNPWGDGYPVEGLSLTFRVGFARR